MTVLKAATAVGVRSFRAIGIADPRQPVAEPPVDPRIASLHARLVEAEAALATCRQQAAVEIDAAREAGAAAARQDEDRRVDRIEQGVATAVSAWRERLDGLERLAAVLAEAALSKLFDDRADFADLVTSTLARRVRAIEASAIMRVRVSARDFLDPTALHALAARVGLPSQAIVAESDAPMGSCEIDLQVGKLDLTITNQWDAIARCLADIARDPLA